MNELIGVPLAYFHKFTLRKYTFGYDRRALITGVLVSFFGNPTGDANNTKTSLLGFAKLADSIAHACL